MNPTYFTNPELSHRLELLGVKSQFDYWYRESNTRLLIEHVLQSDVLLLQGEPSGDDWKQQAYHFSDLLLPSEIKKIWPHAWDWLEKTILLMRRVQEHNDLKEMSINVDWNSWLSEELDKRV